MNPIQKETLSLSFPGKTPLSHIVALQFSDVHIGPGFSPHALEEAVRQMRQVHPDLYLFTGDLTGLRPLARYASFVIEQLRSLQAPLGKWAVWGNHDCCDSPELFPEVMRRSGFVLLENTYARLWPGGPVVGGVKDGIHSKPNLRLFQNVQAPFRLLLLHEPDLIDMAPANSFDLALAGHTHGGQISLPVIGTVVLPRYGRRYPAGLYNAAGGKLYVNRGLGTSDFPLRLGVPGELTVFHLCIPSA